MKKRILFIFFTSFAGVSFASDLSNWSNEDLCRWVDSVSIPEPISLEIKLREVICYDNFELVESSLAAPYQNEHGTDPAQIQVVRKRAIQGQEEVFSCINYHRFPAPVDTDQRDIAPSDRA